MRQCKHCSKPIKNVLTHFENWIWVHEHSGQMDCDSLTKATPSD